MPEEAKKMESVIVKKVSASREEILNCGSQVWAGVRGQTVEMGATPLANQPSPYIKATFDENKIGAVKEIQVKGVHNGKEVFFCLEWKSEAPNYEIGDIGTFPDGIGILFPFKDPEKTQIKEMGSQEFPTNSSSRPARWLIMSNCLTAGVLRLSTLSRGSLTAAMCSKPRPTVSSLRTEPRSLSKSSPTRPSAS